VKNKPSDHFDCEEHNALWTAAHNAAKADLQSDNFDFYDEENTTAVFYHWTETATRHSLVTDLVRELHSLGFKIVKNHE